MPKKSKEVTKNTKYTEAEKERWITCYHEAGHAVIFAYGEYLSYGSYHRSTEEINVYREEEQEQEHARGSYVPHDGAWADTTWDHNKGVASHYAEKLNPHTKRRYKSVWSNPNCKQDLINIKERHMSFDSTYADYRRTVDGACKEVEQIMSLSGVQMSIHALAHKLFRARKSRISGRRVDELLSNWLWPFMNERRKQLANQTAGPII